MTPNKLPPLPELEEVLDLIGKATQGPWAFINDKDGDSLLAFGTDTLDFDRPPPWYSAWLAIEPNDGRALIAAVNFLRNHGEAVAEALRQSQSLPAGAGGRSESSKLIASGVVSPEYVGSAMAYLDSLRAKKETPSDEELPGMWSHQDFTSSQPDEVRGPTAGAVAGLVQSWRDLATISDPILAHVIRDRADELEQALQADAREKGEACIGDDRSHDQRIILAMAETIASISEALGLNPDDDPECIFDVIDDLKAQPPRESFVTFEGGHMKLDINAFLASDEGKRQLQAISKASEQYATQPAQASEKDECASVPRDALLTEARRLRYRATETYGLGPAMTDAGAQMIHTAEALEGFASSGQEKK